MVVNGLGKEIEKPEEIIFDVTEVLVIDILHRIYPVNDFSRMSDYPDLISLKDISDKYPSGCYKVIVETPLSGAIYRYNNYGKQEWIKIGVMMGYA